MYFKAVRAVHKVIFLTIDDAMNYFPLADADLRARPLAYSTREARPAGLFDSCA